MLTTLLAAAVLSSPADAQVVNLRNANLYYGVDDVRVQKPGVPLEIRRSYNSRSIEMGHFGFGWSTNLDVTCQDGPDGTVLVTDSDGFILRYTVGGEPRERVVERYVDSLVKAREDADTQAGSARSDAFYTELRDKLLADPDERRRFGEVTQSGWIDPQPGDYVSYDRGTEKLTKKADGSYLRIKADGSRQGFDDRGRLRSYTNAAKQGLRLDYDRDGRLVKVTHSEGGSVTLTWSTRGWITEILDTEARRITYNYDENGNLVQVVGPEPRKLAYAYDAERNLVAAREADGEGFQVSYDMQRDWVTALKVGDDVTRYAWTIEDAWHYNVAVTDPAGQTTVHSYDDQNNRQMVRGPDGATTETLLSACCAKPLEVRAPDGRITRYDYDQNARLVSVEHPDGRKVRYSWHPEWSRIMQAMYSDGRRFTYGYDDAGNLVEAVDARGRTLELHYGRNGKVEEIIDRTDNGTYQFRYDDYGRPVEIAKGAKGALSIRYGVMGEIAGTEIVEGDNGRGRFYGELREVLDMLEPATGQVQ